MSQIKATQIQLNTANMEANISTGALQQKPGTDASNASELSAGPFTGLLSTDGTVQEALSTLDGLLAENIPISGLSTPLNTASDVKDALETTALELSAKVDTSGSTMTGFLTLHANPSSNLHAATKQYTDAKVRDQITNGITSSAPSENAVFNALSTKLDVPAAGFKIQSGTINMASSNSTSIESVVFPQAFSSTPVISLTLDSNTNDATEVRLRSISNTGFTAKAYNIASSGGTTPYFLHWIAVGA